MLNLFYFQILGSQEFHDFPSKEEKSPQVCSIMRKIEVPPDVEFRSKVQLLDEYQKEVINIGVKYCRDLVKARKAGNPIPEAPKVMVHGGAGAGKSTVINILATMTQKILQKPGDNPDHPYVLKAAFTGTAACNIKGNLVFSRFCCIYNVSFLKVRLLVSCSVLVLTQPKILQLSAPRSLIREGVNSKI